MTKKILSLMLSIVLIFSFSLVASADSPVMTPGLLEQNNSDVMPCFEYTNTTYASLSISSSGTATCTTSLNGYTGTTTKIVIKMTLQKKTLLWWSAQETWTTTINDSFGSLVKTASVGGGTYRVKVEFTVYSGSNSEEITTYSQEKTY